MASPAVRCPNCLDPALTVNLYKVQNQLSLFFIPIWRSKAKYLWICDRCKWTGLSRPEEQVREETELGQQNPPLPTWGLTRCTNCSMECSLVENDAVPTKKRSIVFNQVIATQCDNRCDG
ncbi:14504_t:CDS:2 [Funneliformis geosporum]|nr:14504_t:CDS:2 [Funneliformis geosporum]